MYGRTTLYSSASEKHIKYRIRTGLHYTSNVLNNNPDLSIYGIEGKAFLEGSVTWDQLIEHRPSNMEAIRGYEFHPPLRLTA